MTAQNELIYPLQLQMAWNEQMHNYKVLSYNTFWVVLLYFSAIAKLICPPTFILKSSEAHAHTHTRSTVHSHHYHTGVYIKLYFTYFSSSKPSKPPTTLYVLSHGKALDAADMAVYSKDSLVYSLSLWTYQWWHDTSYRIEYRDIECVSHCIKYRYNSLSNDSIFRTTLLRRIDRT